MILERLSNDSLTILKWFSVILGDAQMILKPFSSNSQTILKWLSSHSQWPFWNNSQAILSDSQTILKWFSSDSWWLSNHSQMILGNSSVIPCDSQQFSVIPKPFSWFSRNSAHDCVIHVNPHKSCILWEKLFLFLMYSMWGFVVIHMAIRLICRHYSMNNPLFIVVVVFVSICTRCQHCDLLLGLLLWLFLYHGSHYSTGGSLFSITIPIASGQNNTGSRIVISEESCGSSLIAEKSE